MLNYHHLRLVPGGRARGRGDCGGAGRKPVAFGAVGQLAALEGRLGHALFDRIGRRMILTEAGRIALDHADTIFATGDELLATLGGGVGAGRRLRVGAQTTLSRNFQIAFLKPLLVRADVELDLRAGALRDLLHDLDIQTIDVVLATEPPPADTGSTLIGVLIDEAPVAIVGLPGPAVGFPHGLADHPLIVPGRASRIRRAFDRIMADAGIVPVIRAEADDMALLRLIARETGDLALVPPIVVRDELASGVLVDRAAVPGLSERFYAIVQKRRFPNPLLADLLPRR